MVGRPPSEAGTLRQYLQRTYDPWISWVAESPATESMEVVGAVVAGVPRAVGATEGAGGGLSGPGNKEGRIVFLGVKPRFRRRGIGRRLLDQALAQLREGQVGRAMLEVDGTEVEALSLFRGAGFEVTGQSLGLVLPLGAGEPLAGTPLPTGDTLRPLALEDVPHLTGLLIQLGIERATQPHDDLMTFTPAELEAWVQRPATVAHAVWEAADPQTPIGLAWATRRPEDALLRFVGVQDDARRRGIGRALVGALLAESHPSRPLRAQLNDPGEEQEFFRRLGFEAERIIYRLAREL